MAQDMNPRDDEPIDREEYEKWWNEKYEQQTPYGKQLMEMERDRKIKTKTPSER